MSSAMPESGRILSRLKSSIVTAERCFSFPLAVMKTSSVRNVVFDDENGKNEQGQTEDNH